MYPAFASSVHQFQAMHNKGRDRLMRESSFRLCGFSLVSRLPGADCQRTNPLPFSTRLDTLLER